MSYAVVAYALVIAAVLAYAGWLARASERLTREVRARAGTNRG